MMKHVKMRRVAALSLSLALIIPVGSAAASPGPYWQQTGQRTVQTFAPISSSTKVLSSKADALSVSTETRLGKIMRQEAVRFGEISKRDEADPASDKLTLADKSARGEVVGNEWVEYGRYDRQKAFKRFFSQQERVTNIHEREEREVVRHQVTDQLETTESWIDPFTKQVKSTTAQSSKTYQEDRPGAWVRVGGEGYSNAGTRTAQWGPELVYAPGGSEFRVTQRVDLTPPGGPNEGWNLVNTEVVRYFQAGNTPPADARQATDEYARQMQEGVDANWELASQETVRYFLAGTVPPAGGVAATPEQRQAMLDPASTGEWLLSNSETFRYFVPGTTPPKDATQATPEQAKQILAEVATAEWQLVDVQTYRDFVAGNVPPQDAGRSDNPAGWDPMEDGAWTVADLKNVRFFVPVPNFENPMPPMPANPAPEVVLGDIVRHTDRSWIEDGAIRMERHGLLIKKFQQQTQVVPRSQTKTTIVRAYQPEPFTTFEYRDIPFQVGGKTETAPFQVPVKNYKWVLQEISRNSVLVPIEDQRMAIKEKSLASERSTEVGALAQAAGDRPGSFQGDSGSSAKAALQAAKLREKLGANEVKASQIALTPAQAAEAKKKAEEEALRILEAENKRLAEEEAKRKAEREEEARREQERRAAEAAEAAARAAAEAAARAAAEAAAKLGNVVQLPGGPGQVNPAPVNPAPVDPLKEAVKAAKAGFDTSRGTLSDGFKGKIEGLLDMFDPFKLDKDIQKEVDKKKQDLFKALDDKLKDLERDFEGKSKDIKDQAALTKWKQDYQKKIDDLTNEFMGAKLKEAHKAVATVLNKVVEQGGTMRTGEEANVNGQSVMALYSHDTGRWVLLAFSQKNYKGDVTVLDSGIDPRKSKQDTVIIPEFTYNGVKLEFKVDHSKGLFGDSYDATINKK